MWFLNFFYFSVAFLQRSTEKDCMEFHNSNCQLYIFAILFVNDHLSSHLRVKTSMCNTDCTMYCSKIYLKECNDYLFKYNSMNLRQYVLKKIN
jgi:hypothetical protein